MTEVVSYAVEGEIAVITIDSPPVNAMGQAVRQGVCEAMDRLAADKQARAAVLICAGRTFIAGADISEFGKPVRDPWLPEVVARIESSEKPVIAAIHGTALGGGLETALGCHYRCAVPSAKAGLPEVNLGLLPGASGTQRLPRLTGVRKALDLMIAGKPVSAQEAKASGIVDEIVEGDLRAGAIAYAKRLLAGKAPLRRISRMPLSDPEATPQFFAEYRKQIARQARGYFAPEQIVKCVEAAATRTYAEGLKVERELFDQCMASPQSKAMRHLFFAEREVARVPGISKDTAARPLKKIAIIGAGTMGGGIAMNFLNAGLPVTLLEMNREALDRGIGIVRKNYEAAVSKGRMTEQQLADAINRIRPSTDYADLADADLVIEAVYENMDIKKQVFTKLDATCKAGAVLATNTSTLDVDAIAGTTRRPQDVIGLHFFAPANIMPLLEIVRGEKTAPDVVATALALAKTIRKTGVVVGVCFGFVGNRMFVPYMREAQLMILEGAAPERIDQVAVDWGMAMGPNAVFDLSGVDVFCKMLNEWKDRPDDPAFCRMGTVLYELGRLGQKTGAGFYKYEGRTAVPDPGIMDLARQEAERLKIMRRDIADEEILDRLLFPMINEGALILQERIALRPGDIDVIYANGYGFPRYRGGPMHYADSVGLDRVLAGTRAFGRRYGDRYWRPAPLLEKLAKEGKTFAGWKEGA